MFEQSRSLLRQTFFALLASSGSIFWNSGAALATNPFEAAQDLAKSGETDPNGFTLMIVSICMLFVFALSIIIATTVQTFKKKPPRARAPQVQRKEPSTAGYSN